MSARLEDFLTTLPALNGLPLDPDAFAGRVVLVVNTASRCGFTPQYEGLEALYQRYRDHGLVVLGCPCNQFGEQEPGDAAAITVFCQKNFGVTFPMSEKINVNGPHAHPLWQWLTATKPGFLGTRRIKWNFTKFLIDQNGRVVRRFAPQTKPEKLAARIEKLLG
ncbi:glutathione peroxidase [Crenobacter cavernae]|uniref:Glutathione peroxidase n=1 Tax=Crenobacter cavernae TaxID=2290923 RepID=A0ABY0FIE4_9NEIS|nr:glutathione peroxidase [Crenobacter cavernae]RXZ45416.1 glutathione peroxidase [Crenobacter cavernae]